MPFIPIYNIAKYQNYKDTPKIAKVINNNDPSKLGRIKVQLPGMYEPKDSEGSNLPWIRRMQDTFLCGSGEAFSIPEEGSFVEVIWPYDNKNAFYRGLPYGEKSKTGFFTGDYPNEWGFTDGTFLFKVNKATDEFIIKNSGMTIKGDSGGNITINGGNIIITGNTTIDGKSFLGHQHSNGNNGFNTGGVV